MHSETKTLRHDSTADSVRRQLADAVTWLLDRPMRLMQESRTVLGIEVWSYMLEKHYRPVFFGRVQRALELIARYEPRRFGRIRRDVRTIRGVTGGPNFYQRVGRGVVLSLPTVLSSAAANLAMTIVHEATHGRLEDRGIRYYDENRARIEAACVRQAAIFARSLPGGEALADAELKILENPWWSDEAMRDGTLRFARAEELPSWAIRLIEWRFKRRAASRQAE